MIDPYTLERIELNIDCFNYLTVIFGIPNG